ncbi:MAG TPA: hypothetical protein DCS82_07610 [Rhodospirillaceae bacterium]|nr:hypothetical protein [Rhodospirillaceae bacterium]HAT35566.1 hypothetical protein [Rhodospirillaceae bacterium]
MASRLSVSAQYFSKDSSLVERYLVLRIVHPHHKSITKMPYNLLIYNETNCLISPCLKNEMQISKLLGDNQMTLG